MNRDIVMIHGMWGGAWVWEKFRPFFEERGWNCRTPTLRLHEASASQEDLERLARTSLADYIKDLEALISDLDEAPVLMGHSMGGWLVQKLAERGFGRAAILLTPAAPAGIPALTPSVVRCFWRTLIRPFFWKKTTFPSYATMSYSMGHLLPEAECRRVWEHSVPESGRATFELGLWPLDFSRAAAVDESSIQIPMLAIAGKEDRIVPASVVSKVARKYGAEYLEFEGHAHWVIGEPGWEEIASTILDWLEKLPSS